jgi:hypothetical protein
MNHTHAREIAYPVPLADGQSWPKCSILDASMRLQRAAQAREDAHRSRVSFLRSELAYMAECLLETEADQRPQSAIREYRNERTIRRIEELLIAVSTGEFGASEDALGIEQELLELRRRAGASKRLPSKAPCAGSPTTRLPRMRFSYLAE